MTINSPSPESQELKEILRNTETSNIQFIIFTPTIGESFTVDTENVKKLAVYISTKLGKTEFEPKELERAFGFVINNLESTLDAEEYEYIKEKIAGFVEEGGKIEIINKVPDQEIEGNYFTRSILFKIIRAIILVSFITAVGVGVGCGGGVIIYSAIFHPNGSHSSYNFDALGGGVLGSFIIGGISFLWSIIRYGSILDFFLLKHSLIKKMINFLIISILFYYLSILVFDFILSFFHYNYYLMIISDILLYSGFLLIGWHIFFKESSKYKTSTMAMRILLVSMVIILVLYGSTWISNYRAIQENQPTPETTEYTDYNTQEPEPVAPTELEIPVEAPIETTDSPLPTESTETPNP